MGISGRGARNRSTHLRHPCTVSHAEESGRGFARSVGSARTRIDGHQRLAARGSSVARDSPPGSRARGSRRDARRPARPDGSPDRRPGRGAARPQCGARGRARRALGAAGAGRGRGAPRRHHAPGGGRHAGTLRRRDAPAPLAPLPFPRASPSPRCPQRSAGRRPRHLVRRRYRLGLRPRRQAPLRLPARGGRAGAQPRRGVWGAVPGPQQQPARHLG